MRIFELTTTVVLVAYLTYQISPHRDNYSCFACLPLVCLPIIILHLIIESARWEMLPIYLVFIAATYQAVASQWAMDVQTHYIINVLGLGCVGVGIVLSTVFPVFELPSPTGPYPVGTTSRLFIDRGRTNPADLGGPRELMVQIWYPTDRSSMGKVAAYQQRATTTVWDARFSLAKTHSIIDASLRKSQSRYPVLLYAPSWNGMRTENTHLAEELASRGYVIVGIDHPYSSFATVFPDGHVIRSRLLDEDFYSTESSFNRFLETAETEIQARTDDVRFVVNALGQLDEADSADLFANRLDLDRLGIFGFSLGGGVAAQACWRDSRFKACLNMDGFMAGESLKQRGIAPLFFMSEADPIDPQRSSELSLPKRREKALDWEQFVQARKLFSTFGGYWLTIKPAKHFNFSDYAFSSPIHFFSRSGAIDPVRVAGTIDRYAFAFFELYLRGNNHKWLEEPVGDLAEYRFEKAGSASEGSNSSPQAVATDPHSGGRIDNKPIDDPGLTKKD
ncbi:hypothetical protein QA645_32075 [Bradyrhizobium sp. CIAT3101]|uniref:alpha/beta hydrolase family protein n=1 Tax=Bradyrhizobium sp. CIAT3101 TaxID=439387 RepID=UPI0024B1C1AC|nr:hypothetical protein [Bradyrhizobium sp. CIAT3101]WFU79134.1 hypothetical protein QA645_32075 [Bradyrhizobium sp. CIAT3101]